MVASKHALKRMAQRNLSERAVIYIMSHAKLYTKDGALIYFLRRCDIPYEDQTQTEYVRLEGTLLILTPDEGTLITVMRNRKNGLRNIHHKKDYNWRDNRQYDRVSGGWL